MLRVTQSSIAPARFRRRLIVVALLACLLLQNLLQSLAFVSAQEPSLNPQAGSVELTGTLEIVVKDSPVRAKLNSEYIYTLIEKTGKRHKLNLNAIPGADQAVLTAYAGKQVRISASQTSVNNALATKNTALAVSSITGGQSFKSLHEGEGQSPLSSPPAALSGAFPYLIIPCKFADISIEPRNQAFFQGLFANAYPGFDHYIREMSYGAVTLDGSQAVNWVTLAKSKDQYLTEGSGEVDPGAIRVDCLNAALTANPSVSITNFKGMGIMLNDTLAAPGKGPSALGTLGASPITINGAPYPLQTAWVPYLAPTPDIPNYPTGFSWETHTLISHEVNHNFKSPHTGDIKGNEYKNPWDTVSQDEANCTTNDPAWRNATYGCIAQHVTGLNKVLMGFLPDGRRQDWSASVGAKTYTLDRLANPTGTNPLVIRIADPLSGRKFYTVEARFKTGYDVKLPSEGVVIYDTDQARREGGNPNAPFGYVNAPDNDTSKAWTVGTTYNNANGKFAVRVDSATADTFTVTVLPLDNVLTFAPADVPAAAENVAYNLQLTASGGTAPYTFRLKDGQLPTGLSLNGDTISGTATRTGTYKITLAVTDANGATAERNYSLVVGNLPGTTGVEPANLPGGAEGAKYSQKLSGVGGSGSGYTFKLIEGFLPLGLKLGTDGVLSGEIDTPGDYYFVIEVTDSDGGKDLHEFEVLVDNAETTFDIDPFFLFDGQVGQAYSEYFSGYDGVAPYTYKVRAGTSLPPGLSLNGDTLSGTPTQAGEYLIVIEATDATGKTNARAYTFYVLT